MNPNSILITLFEKIMLTINIIFQASLSQVENSELDKPLVTAGDKPDVKGPVLLSLPPGLIFSVYHLSRSRIISILRFRGAANWQEPLGYVITRVANFNLIPKT